jgi:hypothetical protein
MREPKKVTQDRKTAPTELLERIKGVKATDHASINSINLELKELDLMGLALVMRDDDDKVIYKDNEPKIFL